MNTATLNTTRLIRLPEVLHKTGYKKAWIYRLISENRFPKPIKLGLRAVAFIEVEIDQWISETISNSRKSR
ncbi:helix-turn-helix transcriptional regulator [Erwinia amylovora]|uniref:helix-turn-helix transcriptional regulator n=1 Tax=Erwinia amylovora TaxID=552 RepID=UPI00144420C5|nr:AlpA family transcriptional regulator [Erwinia amylovora]